MKNNPLVSVCIPTYNSASFIRDTLACVLNQTYPNIEINISDDASDDNTIAIVESISDARIVLKKNTSRLGLEGNWNSALSMAKGTYIKMLCADDILDRTCIEKQVSVFENDGSSQSLALVVCNSNIISPSGKQVMKRPVRLKAGVNNPKTALKKCLLWGTNVIGEPNVGLFRASITLDLHYDCSNPYMLDSDFWFKLLKRGMLYVQNEQLARFFFVKLFLRFLYQTYNVAHTEDTVGHTFGVKHVERFHFFARTDKLQRLVDYGANGNGGAAARVAV